MPPEPASRRSSPWSARPPPGKTGLSLDLAERLGGEIVNTDAMAVYRGMDIGTAKPPVAERRGIPHHLLDLLDVTEPLTVAEFQGWARAAIAEVRGRGRVPVLVGGSALYTRAVLDRFEFPGTDPDVRRGLEDELAAVGPARAPPPAGRGRPRGGRPDPARQRPPDRAGPRGRRDHRPAVQRLAARARVRRPAHRPGRGRHRPAHARPADRAAGPRDVRRRVRRRGTPPPRRRSRGGPHRPRPRSATAR